MIILDRPYVSKFLKCSASRQNLPVLDTAQARALAGDADLRFTPAASFFPEAKSTRIYANSENSLELIMRELKGSPLASMIEICKDKLLFRETISDMYPEYGFAEVDAEDLDAFDPSVLPLPFIVKPARGFFSLGVHRVESDDDWPEISEAIRNETDRLNDQYPSEVVSAGTYIAEEAIGGREYAVDVYWDENGRPVVLNILHHPFGSEDDVSDRLYYTSDEVMRSMLKPVTEFAAELGKVCGFRDFPAHVEIRVLKSGRIIPIEANPLRFAGWCVADITRHAWGFDPYEYYFTNRQPDWNDLLEKRAGTTTAMTIGDIPADVDRKKLDGFDHDAFESLFDTVLELREIDWEKYPVFAFVFSRTDNANLPRLMKLLEEDFRHYLR
ncbi:ATP-grasp domain-containing protein [Salidesulfovibrio brasiliensis]|uniref:ATP-grasp domain-containing protein n=1 Tax=Salidesulfovibrio brasiliensis TaxID=221711 RepID=UPI0006D29DF3|nr:ATP-grasp domain-containing protein [Salidesulfovibrio brasiliensis]